MKRSLRNSHTESPQDSHIRPQLFFDLFRTSVSKHSRRYALRLRLLGFHLRCDGE
jgi:hypothetical protein